MRLTSLPAVASAMVAIAVAAAPLEAQITTYSTRGAFTGAAGALTTENFQSCGSSTVTLGLGATLSNSSLGPCASIQAGITFGSTVTPQLYIAAPGQSSNSTTALGMDLPSGGTHKMTFSSAIRAFGVDLYQNMGGGFQSGVAQAFTAELFGTGGSLGIYNFDVASSVGGFFGFTSLSDVTEVRIAQTTGYAVMDDVSWSASSTAVPEPASFALVLPGLAVLGVVARRRRHTT